MTQVVAAGELPAEESEDGADVVEQSQGAPRSPLEILKGYRAKIKARLHFDLAVPRADEVLGGNVVWVRYTPADPAFLSDALRKREEAFRAARKKSPQGGDPDWATKANCDLLVKCCLGVYFLEPGELPPEGDLPPDLPTFGDPELSDILEAPHNAVATVRALYSTNADILIAANQLLGWSGQASKEAEEENLKA